MVSGFLIVLYSMLVMASAQSCVPASVHGYCTSTTCAGDDISTTCMNKASLPSGWAVMFDTFDYNNLVATSITRGAALLSVQFDGDTSSSDQWRHTGSLCQYAMRPICKFDVVPQDNWLFSRHVKYPTSSTTIGGGLQTEVNVEMRFRFSQCRSTPGCTKSYVNMYRYDISNQVDNQRSTTDYQPMFGAETETTDSRFEQDETTTDNTITRTFLTTGDTGFHFAVRDEGTCGQVSRITIYYTPCPTLEDGLVYYPELVRPPEGSEPYTGTACCVDNAHPTTSLTFTAPASGECERNVGCECDPGYSVDSTGTACEGCPAGTYRSLDEPQDACLPCPANTLLDAVIASECRCIANHFRAASEAAGADCTAAPSNPTGLLQCSVVTGNSITVSWGPPAEDGGRIDTFYEIEYQLLTSTEGFISAGSDTELMFTLSGLEALTQYKIKVYAENGVSDQDMRPGIRETRSIETICETDEDVPEAPSSTQVIENIVLVWQPPTKPNGVIIGYQISISYTSPTEGEVSNPGINLAADVFVYVLRVDVVPANVTANIKVRARTSAGYGEYSESIMFEPFAAPAVTGAGCSPGDMALYLGLAALGGLVLGMLLMLVFSLFCCLCKKCCHSKDKDSLELPMSNGLAMKQLSVYS